MFDQSEDNPNYEQVEAAKKKVLAVYPDAQAVAFSYGDGRGGRYEVWCNKGTQLLGEGMFDDVWTAAASRLPAPVESKAHTDTSKMEEMTDAEFDTVLSEPKAQVESASVEPKTDVYEVFGSCATNRGWDFLVCTTLSNALENISDSLDSLEEGEEVKIVFRRYTANQMDEVIYE